MKSKQMNSQIHDMTEPELYKQLEDLSKERYNLAVQAKTGQLQNSARAGIIRKDIARIRTEQTRRRAASAAA